MSEPELRFEAISTENRVEEIPIASFRRSGNSKVLVSLVRSKHGAGGPLISVAVWFRSRTNDAWHPDHRRRGAILRPEEIEDVCAALEKARKAAWAAGWKVG